MFSLNQELALWTEQVNRHGKLGAEEIAELQDHLLIEFTSLKNSGVSEAKAFDQAVQKIGTVKELAREYAKNRRLDQVLNAVANANWLMKLLGVLLVTGGGLHVYYSLRYFWFVQDGLNPLTFAVFLVMVWSVIKGMMLLADRNGGSAGLFFFFLFQIPALYPADSNYELTTGLAVNLYVGDIASRVGINLGSELHINAGEASTWQYGSINLLAVFVCVLMLLRIWQKRREKRLEEAWV